MIETVQDDRSPQIGEDLMRRFDLRVHQAVRDLVPDDAVAMFSNRMLGCFDMIFDSTTLKASRLAEYHTKGKGTIIVKVVMARGKEQDGITLTVPRPLAGAIAECNECQRVGYMNLRDRELCPQCNGLGYLEKLPSL